jgi:hypothetical protein
MRTLLCRPWSACRLLFLLLAVLIGAGSASALTLSATKPKIGEPIRVLDPEEDRYYSVFWTNLDGPRADPCASVSGSELLEDSDLRHYGTCFSNDEGTFQVVELDRNVVANYTDSLQHYSYVTKQTVVVKGWLFEFVMTAKDVSVPRGQPGHTPLTATLSTGKPNPVTFDVVGLPDAVRAAATPEACTLSCTATISFDVSALADLGSYPITVIGSGVGAPSQSATLMLTVVAGGVTSFRIEADAGGDIGTQKAGTAFPIRIIAQNGDYSDNTAFTGTADLSTTAGAVTPPVSGRFVNGVRTETLTVTMPGTGRTIGAKRTGGTESGTSNAFTVLDGGPVTTIVSYPASPSNNMSAPFTFSAPEPGTTFECKLDAAAWTPCTSPVAYSSVSDGAHTFQVRGTSSGYAESAPPSITWVVDATAPDTVFDSVPPASTYVTSAMFLFSATEPGSTFQCRLDAAEFAPCLSPVTIGSVPFGRHTFEVRAIDPAGNVDASAAGQTWAVERRALIITAINRSKVYGDEVTFSGTEFSVTGLQGGDRVTGVALASTGAASSAPAGTYPVVPAAAQGSGLSNYVISYENATLTVGQAPSTTTVVCADATYTGAAIESCTASVSGRGGLNQALAVTYTNNREVGTASAKASFAGDRNYTGSTAEATFKVNPAAAHHLTFSVQPASISAGKPMNPAVTVRIVDANNNLVTNDNTTTVSLSIGANPGRAVLTNGGARVAVNGVATFSGVALDKAGANYTLAANSPSTPAVIGDTSAPFTITANLTLGVSVSAMSFGNVPLATPSATRTLTLSNPSSNAVPLTSISTGNSEFAITADTCAGSVPAKVGTTNGTCSLTVTLMPTSIGPRTGTLTVVSGVAGAPPVSLSGTGTFVLAASVSAADFGNVPVATASVARTVTLTNGNGIAIPLTSVATDNNEFAIAANTCGGSVPAKSGTTNGTCSLTLKLTPAAIAARTATLTIANGATNTPVVSLRGTGTLLLAASVSAVDFGNVTVGTASTARTVTLTNVSGVAIPLTSVATGNIEFAVTANTCGTSVPAKTGTTNGSCSLTLKLAPAAAGTRTATLAIVSGATNSLAVSLVGTGIAP